MKTLTELLDVIFNWQGVKQSKRRVRRVRRIHSNRFMIDYVR